MLLGAGCCINDVEFLLHDAGYESLNFGRVVAVTEVRLLRLRFEDLRLRQVPQTWKETYERDLNIWKETYKRDVHIAVAATACPKFNALWRCGFFACASLISVFIRLRRYEKSPTCMKRDVQKKRIRWQKCAATSIVFLADFCLRQVV